MEKVPNKAVLDLTKYILDNALNIEHCVCITISKDGSMSVNQTGGIPRPIHALMQSFFQEVSRKSIFGSSRSPVRTDVAQTSYGDDLPPQVENIDGSLQ